MTGAGTNWVKVPVRVTAPFVGALHTAVPLVESLALLIWMSVGSGFDQVPPTIAIQSGTAQPGGAVGCAAAMN